jgi:hypothetical protein
MSKTQDIAMKYNINLIRGCMRLTTIVIVTVALASSAFAKIGEHYNQVISEARSDRDCTFIRPENFHGKTALFVQYRNGDTIRHLFGSNGREIAFYWFADHNVTNREIGIVMRIFKTRWYAVPATDPQWTKWQSDSGLAMLVDRNYLCILDLARLDEIPGSGGNNTESTPPPRRIVPRDPSDMPNDCLLLATQAYARLKPPTSYWAKIAGLRINKNGAFLGGHAVLFYQPTEKSNVWVYDNEGSFDLGIKSHDLTVIASAYNRLLSDSFSASGLRWIEDDDSQKHVAQDDTPDAGLKRSQNTPELTTDAGGVATTNPSIEAKVKAQNPDVQRLAVQCVFALVGITALSLYVWSVVICFLKGKPVFGTLGILALFVGGFSLWAIIGASRIAKPTSWWARKKYSPEKMKIANQRFPSHVNKTVTTTAPAAVPPPVPASMMQPAAMTGVDVN